MSDSPYSPPKSKLEKQEPVESEFILWKIFFVLSLVLFVIAMAGIALLDELSVSVFDYFDIALSIVSMIGLFGFAFSRPIGKQVIWKIFFFIMVAQAVIYTFILPGAGVPRYGKLAQFSFWYDFEIIYSIILCWALFLYSFKRGNVWENA